MLCHNLRPLSVRLNTSTKMDFPMFNNVNTIVNQKIAANEETKLQMNWSEYLKIFSRKANIEKLQLPSSSEKNKDI